PEIPQKKRRRPEYPEGLSSTLAIRGYDVPPRGSCGAARGTSDTSGETYKTPSSAQCHSRRARENDTRHLRPTMLAIRFRLWRKIRQREKYRQWPTSRRTWSSE